MSSSSRRSPPPATLRPLLAALALAVALLAALGSGRFASAAGAVLPGKAKPATRRTLPAPAPPAVVADESTRVAQSMIADLRALYGGDDNWARIDGFRYYMTYTIPGPGGAPVRTWTEAHFVWVRGVPRARIDIAEDSTIVIVVGDTTKVRRAGAWMTDSLVVAAGRAQALDALWAWHLPRNLVDPRIRARQLGASTRGKPVVTRFFFDRPGLERPQGTVLTVTFAPPTYAMRRLHWFDPRGRAWYVLELADDHQRYGFTWAQRRTLHASDAAGEAGPVLWTAVLEDFQIEGQMPALVLSPPGAGAGVVAVHAAADTTARR